jgi:Zn-dependent peptidase ImmA (M78 family)/transcriptional regulator with XRE-family HTH domain
MAEQGFDFIGDRLREARNVRDITAAALSNATHIPASAISAYERGHYNPPPHRLDALAGVLHVKTDFFSRTLAPSTREAQVVFERSRASTTKATRRRAEYQREWLREVVAFLGQYLNMPVPDLPAFARDVQWDMLTDDSIERLAGATRLEWAMGDGPVSNVTLLAENHGIIVTYIRIGSPKLDAFSAWDVVDGRPYIVLGNDGQSACRVRFNVCHELAHLILHQNVSRPQWEDPQIFRTVERQAHRFASAFLTPASSVTVDLRSPTLNGIRMAKPKWKASIKMLIHRTHELGFLTQDEVSRLYANYNRRGWQHAEPYDQDWAVERPVMLRRAFEAMDKRGLIARHQIPAALPFNQADIEQLTGLPTGYFDQDIWGFLDTLTADFTNVGDSNGQ